MAGASERHIKAVHLPAQLQACRCARCAACRLVDEWGAIEKNKTVPLNATLCSIFPADFCPDGGRGCCHSWLGLQAAGLRHQLSTTLHLKRQRCRSARVLQWMPRRPMA